ncbi:MAG: hypothetical protein WKG07_41925 [Hymenobacter sp.]
MPYPLARRAGNAGHGLGHAAAHRRCGLPPGAAGHRAGRRALGYHADGDYLGHATEFELSIRPLALEVAG